MLKNIIEQTDFSELYRTEKSDYFRRITTTEMDYWDTHERMFATVPKTAKILDVGVWFGIVPWALQQLGYTDVSTTECEAHSQGKRESFEVLWSWMNIQPFELHIKPQQEFVLPDTYDVITMTKSNVFWKTEEVVHHAGDLINTEWQVTGADNQIHSYFTLYNVDDWVFFVNNIRKFLNPGGRALIQPEPWAYDSIAHYSTARDYLLRFKRDGYLEIKK